MTAEGDVVRRTEEFGERSLSHGAAERDVGIHRRLRCGAAAASAQDAIRGPTDRAGRCLRLHGGLDRVRSAEFDRQLIDTVRATYIPDEHEHSTVTRTLLDAWAPDDEARRARV